MEVKYNVSGERRKEMVQAVSKALEGWSIEYLGAPSFSYRVGDFEITRDGTLVFSDRTDSKMVEDVLEGLEQAGFEFEEEQPSNTSQFAGPYEMPWDEDCNQKKMTDEEMAEAMDEHDRLLAEAVTAPHAEAAFPSACRRIPSRMPPWRTLTTCWKARATSSRKPSASKKPPTPLTKTK